MRSNILQIAATEAAQFVAIFMLTTSVSTAAVVYTYTGNNYNYFRNNPSIYDTNMNLELSFTTDSLLTSFAGDAAGLVKSFSSFDGVNLLTDSNAPSPVFNLNIDSAGNVLQWDITVATDSVITNIGDSYDYMTTQYIIGVSEVDFGSTERCSSKPFGECITDYDYATIENGRGTWSVSNSAVPIPASAWLFGSGLVGLIGITRRKK